MKIAVATDGNSLVSPVAQEFVKSTHLLIVDMESMDFQAFENDGQKDETGLEMAKIVKEYDCEAVITGHIEGEAFELLAGEQITRYNGAGYTAEEALNLMEKLQLELISDYNGSVGAFHGHSCGGSCDCEEDEC